MRIGGPCMCGDPYCPSCGPAQGYFKCDHGAIQGDCEKLCYNSPLLSRRLLWRLILGDVRLARRIKKQSEAEYKEFERELTEDWIADKGDPESRFND